MSKALDDLQYKKAAEYSSRIPKIQGHRKGWEDAIALELPVRFADYVIKNVDTDDSEDGAYYFQGQWQNIEMIYNFWVNTIYKP